MQAVTESGELPSALPAEPEAQIAAASVSNAVPAEETTAPAAWPAAGEIRMRLEFNDASWTEIYDANGKRLMFGMGESGRVSTVVGRAAIASHARQGVRGHGPSERSSDRRARRAGKDAAKFVVAAGGTVQMASGEVPVE